jgi:origin recognition complex subunit 4
MLSNSSTEADGRDIHDIMTRAIEGESNSLLLLGGPGSGKSAIVADALAKLKVQHPDPGKFYTIQLDGQVQLDDKIALREIARQLALEMNIEMEKVRLLHVCC